jgi:hypothetical protein
MDTKSPHGHPTSDLTREQWRAFGQWMQAETYRLVNTPFSTARDPAVALAAIRQGLRP